MVTPITIHPLAQCDPRLSAVVPLIGRLHNRIRFKVPILSLCEIKTSSDSWLTFGGRSILHALNFLTLLEK